jgi:lipid II:glycine glycyltransferase (peptidoglycan interpeptide bridge formation enzyme)
MGKDCEIIDPRSSIEWDGFVKNHPQGTFFHSGVWASVLCESYGFTPYYIVLRKDKLIVAGLPLIAVRSIFGPARAVSLPFTDFCGPLCDSASQFEVLLKSSMDLSKTKHWAFLEFRGGQEFLKNTPSWSCCFMHEIDLTGSDTELLAACRDSTQRNIKKAKKHSLEITHETTLLAMWKFYKLNMLTRRDHGLPPQPWSFFKILFDLVIAKKQGFISLSYYKNAAVAADLFLIYGDKAIYKFGASNKKFQRLRASNLVMWEGMLHCKALGAKSLNLGRTEPHHEGLLQFKRGFGCYEETVNYYCFDCKSGIFQSEKETSGEGLSNKIMRRAPLFLLRALGKIAYKYVA